MGALGNILNNLTEGWKNISSRRKIGIIVLAGGVITALLFFIIFLGKPKYEPLYLNMAPEDMAKVAEKFKQDKVTYKPDGNTILVPKDQVEELRLSVASSGIMPSNGKGFELFDESRFGMTDTETKILYQRALETEIQRTIKAFDEIEYARVHLVIPEATPFMRAQESARASVTLKFKNSMKLSPEQVKAVVSLISGSVKNLPKENVEVLDSNFHLLSDNLYNGDINAPSSVTDRIEIEKQFEQKLGSDIKGMLEAVFGPDKVKVSINADLDFDSKQSTSIKYDPQGIVKSQYIIKESVNGSGGNISGSPIDNNMSNGTGSGTGANSGKTREEQTTNYNVGQVEEKIVSAPGKVKKIMASVVVDSTLSDTVKSSVNNIVATAVGFDQNRGDLITVEGMPFDDTIKKRIEADLKEMDAQQLIVARNKRLITNIGYPAAGVIGLILLLILLSRLRSPFKERQRAGGVDVVIGEPVAINEVMRKQAILEEDDEKPDLTAELKKYASRKPDQVVEIIKSWLVEDER